MLASAGFVYPGQIGIWRCWFLKRGKTGKPTEKPSEQGENQQQTQPTYCTRPELNAGHISGRRHPCFLEERER